MILNNILYLDHRYSRIRETDLCKQSTFEYRRQTGHNGVVRGENLRDYVWTDHILVQPSGQ